MNNNKNVANSINNKKKDRRGKKKINHVNWKVKKK